MQEEVPILVHELVHYNSVFNRIKNPLKIIEYYKDSNYILSWMKYICKKYNWYLIPEYCNRLNFIEHKYNWWIFDEILAYQTEKIDYTRK